MHITASFFVLLRGIHIEDDDAILFLSEEGVNDKNIDRYSVPSPGSRRSKSHVTGTRAIVVCQGASLGRNIWSCSRDKSLTYECIHIVRAKAHAKNTESRSSPLALADLEEPEVLFTIPKGTWVHIIFPDLT